MSGTEKNMTTLQIFDKPMCCSSGVCGPDVDSALVAFSADLQWLERHGVHVQRINPAHQPALFAGSELVRQELHNHGSDCLPMVVVNDAVVSRGVFPSRQQLADWAGIAIDELSVIPSGCCVGDDKPTGSSSGCCEQS